jgi:hypothetical protein
MTDSTSSDNRTPPGLDDPHHDIAAMQFHLARDMPVAVSERELQRVDVLAANEEAAGGDLVDISTAMFGVLELLQTLRERFDAAGGAPS